MHAGLYRYQFSSLIKPITSALIKDSRAFIGESLKGMLFCLMHTDQVNLIFYIRMGEKDESKLEGSGDRGVKVWEFSEG